MTMHTGKVVAKTERNQSSLRRTFASAAFKHRYVQLFVNSSNPSRFSETEISLAPS